MRQKPQELYILVFWKQKKSAQLSDYTPMTFSCFLLEGLNNIENPSPEMLT